MPMYVMGKFVYDMPVSQISHCVLQLLPHVRKDCLLALAGRKTRVIVSAQRIGALGIKPAAFHSTWLKH